MRIVGAEQRSSAWQQGSALGLSARQRAGQQAVARDSPLRSRGSGGGWGCARGGRGRGSRRPVPVRQALLGRLASHAPEHQPTALRLRRRSGDNRVRDGRGRRARALLAVAVRRDALHGRSAHRAAVGVPAGPTRGRRDTLTEPARWNTEACAGGRKRTGVGGAESQTSRCSRTLTWRSPPWPPSGPS